MKCKNCETEVNSKFCPHCGWPTEIKRIDGHYIIHEIEHALHFERGILFTIKQLLTNPGQNIKNYLTEDRTRLVKPVIFIIITSLIYTILIHLFHIEDQYVKFKGGKTTAIKIFKWIQEHYGYANIMMGIFIAFWIKLFFKKNYFNIYEIIILLCFITGMAMLIYAVFAIVQGITNIDLMAIGGFIGIGYCRWAIGQFFGKDKIINYVKAFFAYIFGMLTFTFGAVILGILLDLMLKQF